jgi:hypothetical protein
MKTIALLVFGVFALLPTRAPAAGAVDGTATAARSNSPASARPDPAAPVSDNLRRWSQIAIDATGFDHTPVAPGEARTFGEQLGPGRASRAMAIVHVAMFEVMNAITPEYRGFTNVKAQVPANEIALNAAIAQAARDTLIALYPSQQAKFDQFLAQDLNIIRSDAGRQNGVSLGQAAAAAVLAQRNGDGVEVAEPAVGTGHPTSDAPGHWRQDPISRIPLALGAYWGGCRPWVLTSGSQFRLGAPPAMDSAEYTAAFDEVKRLGGDGIATPTQRTPEQTFIGIFWAYDGTPSLCAPPRLYNQIAIRVADQMKTNGLRLARLLALLNVAMADSGIAAWDSKYYWDFWRPITGIRESDVGTGPSGLGDGNPNTVGDPGFSPLGAPASNATGPNFTPPFPAYPSGHATFGGAIFQILRRFYKTDTMHFTFVSDEFNGTTRGSDGTVRPLIPRTFENFSQPEYENAISRLYLGIHWNFDASEGIKLGREVGNYVFDNAFRPLRAKSTEFGADSQ